MATFTLPYDASVPTSRWDVGSRCETYPKEVLWQATPSTSARATVTATS